MTTITPPLRIAHRGIPHRERENTLASFALALTEGADGIELDVHATSDGEVVVHHDPVLADGRVIAELALVQLRAASGPHEIPTLGEVMRLVAGAAELFVELKGAGVEGLTLQVLESYDGKAALHSFDHAAISRAAEARSRFPLGLLTEDFVADPVALLRRHGATDFWPHEPLVSPDVMEAVHGMRGGRVIAWTVNDPTRMRELAHLKVDGLCTDDVSLIDAALR